MTTVARLIFFYILFAAIATLANIGTQFIMFRLASGPIAFPLAMISGTAVGLIIKYALDKVWIFDDRETGLKQHASKFTRYSFIGLGTTAIFWGTELTFATIGQWEGWRYIGAILGLSIGYSIKYFADRKFVFARSA
jgi:putative flippase GtrA